MDLLSRIAYPVSFICKKYQDLSHEEYIPLVLIHQNKTRFRGDPVVNNQAPKYAFLSIISHQSSKSSASVF